MHVSMAAFASSEPFRKPWEPLHSSHKSVCSRAAERMGSTLWRGTTVCANSTYLSRSSLDYLGHLARNTRASKRARRAKQNSSFSPRSCKLYKRPQESGTLLCTRACPTSSAFPKNYASISRRILNFLRVTMGGSRVDARNIASSKVSIRA